VESQQAADQGVLRLPDLGQRLGHEVAGLDGADLLDHRVPHRGRGVAVTGPRDHVRRVRAIGGAEGLKGGLDLVHAGRHVPRRGHQLTAPQAETCRLAVVAGGQVRGSPEQADRRVVPRDGQGGISRPLQPGAGGIGQAEAFVRIRAYTGEGRESRLVVGGDRLGDPGDIGSRRLLQPDRQRQVEPAALGAGKARVAGVTKEGMAVGVDVVAGHVRLGSTEKRPLTKPLQAFGRFGHVERLERAAREPATGHRRAAGDQAGGSGEVIQLGGVDGLHGGGKGHRLGGDCQTPALAVGHKCAAADPASQQLFDEQRVAV
jgi:hypothetical protein